MLGPTQPDGGTGTSISVVTRWPLIVRAFGVSCLDRDGKGDHAFDPLAAEPATAASRREVRSSCRARAFPHSTRRTPLTAAPPGLSPAACLTRSRTATCLLSKPAAQPSTIRDRNGNAVVTRHDHDISCARPSSVRASSSLGRPARAIPMPTTYMSYSGRTPITRCHDPTRRHDPGRHATQIHDCCGPG